MGEYVYVNSTVGLWRLRFEGGRLERPKVPVFGERDRGKVTRVCSYENEGVPWGAGIIRWKSKVFFVGGEKRLPNDHPGKEQHYLNRRVYVCEDQDQDWAAKKPFVHICVSGTIPPSAGPKAIPFVVPVKSGPKTLFCVIGQTSPLLDSFGLDFPIFEIFDPESESWTTPEQPDIRAIPGAFSAFEFGGRLFVVGEAEISYCVESNAWKRTSYFSPREVYYPMRTVAVDGLSDDIRIGMANFNGKIYAYKQLHKGNRVEFGVAMQELPELEPYYTNLFPYDLSIERSLSSLGKGVALFISSSCHRCRYSEDYLVHYLCLKLHFTELPSGGGGGGPFVTPRVLDWCLKSERMSGTDMRKVALHIGMRSAFLL